MNKPNKTCSRSVEQNQLRSYTVVTDKSDGASVCRAVKIECVGLTSTEYVETMYAATFQWALKASEPGESMITFGDNAAAIRAPVWSCTMSVGPMKPEMRRPMYTVQNQTHHWR